MEDFKVSILQKLRDDLEVRGFAVFCPGLEGNSSFDLIARRDDEIYVVKVMQNVDTFRESNAMEMVHLSSATGGIAIIVGKKAGNGALEDGIVYFRHRVPILTKTTFDEYVDGIRPFVYSGPGGFYVSLNSRRLHFEREKRGFSIGYVSTKAGTSRRSISLYEAGSDVTFDVFMKLSRLFGPEIASGLDLSKNMHEINENEDHVYPDDDFSRTLFSMLQKIGFGALSFRKTPFDALLTEKMRSVALMEVSKNILLQEEKIRSMKGIADVIGNESIIVPRERTMKVSIYGCPILSISDFRSINDPDDFLELIEKKKSMR